MHHTLSPRRLWLVTAILIAGLIAGYSFSIIRMPNAYGSGLACPANCAGEDCPMKKACAEGKCNKHCPGNCPGNSADKA